MAVIMKLEALGAGIVSSLAGQYLLHCDFEAHGGRGVVYAAPDRDEAMRFPDAEIALAYWKRQSKTVPLRDDGEPNRPLTSCTVSIEPFEDSGGA